MRYLLDSDWCIDALAGKPHALTLVNRLMGDGTAVSIITYLEVYQTVLRSPEPEEAAKRFDAFVATVPVLPLSEAVARRCARLRETLRHAGKRVRPRALDLIIAATALEHSLTIVSRNVADYADIPDLQVDTGVY
ncbi:MAG: type II toxin-antitoxin system VapC family toxin [Chloroflexi bacterium]|nr:type II toxin-antitoxin system VapC family toxin [Chloroflexota bacterium]